MESDHKDMYKRLADDVHKDVQLVMLEEVDKEELKKSKRVPVDFMHIERDVIPTDFIMSIVALIGSIATMMSAATTFVKNVPSQAREDYGEKDFKIVTNILIFFPMVYTLLLVLMMHNKRSTDTFYDLLRYGVLLDFPNSADVGFMVTNWQPLLFIVTSLFYGMYAASIFVQFDAPSQIWLIFYKQFFLEVVVFWMDLQTVENNFMTVSEFFEAFDDRSTDPIIDRYSLTRCAKVVTNFKAVTSEASYRPYAAVHGIREPSVKARRLLNAILIFLIAILCGLAYIQYMTDEAEALSEAWEEKITPCLQVCFDQAFRDESKCYDCLCACTTAFGVSFKTEADYELCAENVDVPGCDNGAMCNMTAPGHNCGGYGLPFEHAPPAANSSGGGG